MHRNIRILLLCLLSSFLLVSCKGQETAVREGSETSAEAAQAEVFQISYGGEIQQFDAAHATGLIQNVKSLVWLAPRGGLEMELAGENLSEEENICIYQSSHWETMEYTDLVWLRIPAPADKQDQGEGTGIPETQDTLAYIQDQDLYIGIQNSDRKWDIWKLEGYGDWFEKELRIFIRIVTGL